MMAGMQYKFTNHIIYSLSGKLVIYVFLAIIIVNLFKLHMFEFEISFQSPPIAKILAFFFMLILKLLKFTLLKEKKS